MGAAAFSLVIVALAVFLLSTRQGPLWLRLLVWIAGAGLLGGAVYLIWWNPAHDGLFRVVAEAIDAPGFLNSTLARALVGNQRSVAGAIVPMLDLFIAGAIIVGLLALLAFTPGERLEKIVRPLAIGLTGAIGGSIITLAIVAIGFGGYQKRQAYFSTVTEVIDGDTFRMGDAVVRLAGIDAPEAAQICLRVNEPPIACGALAKTALSDFLVNKQVICWAPDKLGAETWPPTPMRPLRESFGRVIAQCRAIDAEGHGKDVAEFMVTNGWAILFHENEPHTPNYFAAAEGARAIKQGLWYSCTLKPEAWRDETKRAVFVARNNVPQKDLVGDCAGLLHPPGPA